MPEYRRAYRPGGTYFFTLVTHERRELFRDSSNVERLREAMRNVQAQWPYEALAGVVLFDHMHVIWTLPDGDDDYSKRIGRMKSMFTKSLAGTTWEKLARSAARSRERHGESDVWQRRFWEHVIRDEQDFQNHMNYLHYNPVKHGMCACPHAWAASSFEHWVTRQVYEKNWCCCCTFGAGAIAPYPVELDGTVGE